MIEENSERLYNKQATNWSRSQPTILSDFSARPFVIEMCEPLENLRVFDIGCGEGYVSRQLVQRGAAEIIALDISEKMIEVARTHDVNKITYKVGDSRDLNEYEDASFDIVLTMFLFNYLNIEDSANVMKEIFRMLKPGGKFIMAVPHPSLPFLKEKGFPFYFEPEGNYFTGRNSLFPGEIWRLDRIPVHVQCIHKTWEDYFHCFRHAGFTKMPEVKELHINDSHIALDTEFFSPLDGIPLHVAFKLEKK